VYLCYVNKAQRKKLNTMKRFNFKTQLKGMNIEELKQLRNYHLDWMLRFIGIDMKSFDTHLKYLCFIDNAIANLK
jgi:hypothetical protein